MVKDALAVAASLSGTVTPRPAFSFSSLGCNSLFFIAALFACSVGSGVYVIWREASLALSPAQARAPFGLRVDVLLGLGPSAKRASALIRPDH